MKNDIFFTSEQADEKYNLPLEIDTHVEYVHVPNSCYMSIIESVDSICRDGTDTPIKP